MIPESRIPFIYVDFDNSKAITPGGSQAYNVLLIGQKLDTAVGPSLTPTLIRNEKDVSDLFGYGSMLHLMAKGYFSNTPTAKTYVISLDDPKGSTAAQWGITLEGAYVSNGSLPLFIAGKKFEAIVTKETTKFFSDLADKITKDSSCPLKAEAHESALTLTAKNKGVMAGNIDVRAELGFSKQPAAGLKLKVEHTQAEAGMGDVNLEECIKKIADKQFHIIVNPYTDQESLHVLDQDLTERFLASRQLEGQMIAALGGDDVVLTDSKQTPLQHSKHMTFLATGKNSPTPSFVWAAALSAVVANEGQVDPARPFNTLPIYGCLPDEDGSRYERAARARLLDAGFSTYNVDFNGNPRIERLITTYSNINSTTDQSYLSLNTLLTLSYLRFSFVNYFSAKYPRHKLADDSAIVHPGSAILTPKTAQCEAVALFLSWEEDGLVENFDQFKSDLIVERNTKDRGRLDFFISPRLISQLNVMGAKISFLI